jgi:hypothetical protein
MCVYRVAALYGRERVGKKCGMQINAEGQGVTMEKKNVGSERTVERLEERDGVGSEVEVR